jgi:hypothetical protein
MSNARHPARPTSSSAQKTMQKKLSQTILAAWPCSNRIREVYQVSHPKVLKSHRTQLLRLMAFCADQRSETGTMAILLILKEILGAKLN